MESEFDKDEFCKVWVKQGGIEEMSNRMRGSVYTPTKNYMKPLSDGTYYPDFGQL